MSQLCFLHTSGYSSLDAPQNTWTDEILGFPMADTEETTHKAHHTLRSCGPLRDHRRGQLYFRVRSRRLRWAQLSLFALLIGIIQLAGPISDSSGSVC